MSHILATISPTMHLSKLHLSKCALHRVPDPVLDMQSLTDLNLKCVGLCLRQPPIRPSATTPALSSSSAPVSPRYSNECECTTSSLVSMTDSSAGNASSPGSMTDSSAQTETGSVCLGAGDVQSLVSLLTTCLQQQEKILHALGQPKDTGEGPCGHVPAASQSGPLSLDLAAIGTTIQMQSPLSAQSCASTVEQSPQDVESNTSGSPTLDSYISGLGSIRAQSLVMDKLAHRPKAPGVPAAQGSGAAFPEDADSDDDTPRRAGSGVEDDPKAATAAQSPVHSESLKSSLTDFSAADARSDRQGMGEGSRMLS